MPIVVVIGPPWLRTGTGRVIQDQIAYYRDRGFSTAFVGVPVRPEHGPENPIWEEQSHAAGELRADHASFAILDAPPNSKRLWHRVRQSLAPQTSLDWIVEMGRCSLPPTALLDYLHNRIVAHFHVNHVFTLGFARRLRRTLGQRRGLPLLVETHDIQSQILRDRNEVNPWTGQPDDLNALLRAENALLKEADVLIHCSVDDHRFFREQFPDKPQIVARPSMDEVFVAAVAAAQEIAPIDILLVGTDHHANAEAVEWFLTEVWPLIRSRRYKVRIVGGVKGLVRKRRRDLYNEFHEFFLGRVTDLAPYYRAARSVIAPMRSGGGISVKTIEAFALGRPFIGTAKAYRGFPAEPLLRHGIESYDDPRAFADALLRVLSGGDDIGKRGRAVYEELFSKEACYAARDDAMRMAGDVHAPRNNRAPENEHPTMVAISEHPAVNTNVLVLGTSNCVGPNSFVEKLAAKLGVTLANLSVGACTSTLGLYQLDKVQPIQRGVAFIDFAINDSHVGWHLWEEKSAPHIVAETIRTIVARLRSMNYLPIMVLLGHEHDPLGNALHRKTCLTEGINFIDLRSHLDLAMRRGGNRNLLLRKNDDSHLSPGAAEEVAAFLATVIKRMNATSVTFMPQSAPILQARVAFAEELFPPSALVVRGSSLRSARYGRLAIGESIAIPMANNERLRGVMINVGAKGGTVAIRGSGAEIIKSMTIYWDAKHPEWFGAFLIDFAHPLPGGVGGLIVEMLGPDAVPTQPTMHSKPIVTGRYGELEIEGVLLTSCDPMQCHYSSPVYDWMPLDLGELLEGQQLVDRLASLQN
jgi:glycosyltransferase involved in cell wall biosynthesis